MSEWRGLWRCEQGHFGSQPHRCFDCGHPATPYERRQDDALAAMTKAKEQAERDLHDQIIEDHEKIAAMTRQRDEESEQCRVYAEELGKMWALRDQAERERDEWKARANDPEGYAMREIVNKVAELPCLTSAVSLVKGIDCLLCLSCRARAALKEGEEK